MRNFGSKLGEIDLVKTVEIKGREELYFPLNHSMASKSSSPTLPSFFILYILFLPPPPPPPFLIVPIASGTYKLVPLQPLSPTLFSFVHPIASLMASCPPTLLGLFRPIPFVGFSISLVLPLRLPCSSSVPRRRVQSHHRLSFPLPNSTFSSRHHSSLL